MIDWSFSEVLSETPKAYLLLVRVEIMFTVNLFVFVQWIIENPVSELRFGKALEIGFTPKVEWNFNFSSRNKFSIANARQMHAWIPVDSMFLSIYSSVHYRTPIWNCFECCYDLCNLLFASISGKFDDNEIFSFRCQNATKKFIDFILHLHLTRRFRRQFFDLLQTCEMIYMKPSNMLKSPRN